MDRVESILFEHALTIRHYGWVCIAASHTNVSTYDVGGRFHFGEAPTQGPMFCDRIVVYSNILVLTVSVVKNYTFIAFAFFFAYLTRA